MIRAMVERHRANLLRCVAPRRQATLAKTWRLHEVNPALTVLSPSLTPFREAKDSECNQATDHVATLSRSVPRDAKGRLNCQHGFDDEHDAGPDDNAHPKFITAP